MSGLNYWVMSNVEPERRNQYVTGPKYLEGIH